MTTDKHSSLQWRRPKKFDNVETRWRRRRSCCRSKCFSRLKSPQILSRRFITGTRFVSIKSAAYPSGAHHTVGGNQPI